MSPTDATTWPVEGLAADALDEEPAAAIRSGDPARFEPPTRFPYEGGVA